MKKRAVSILVSLSLLCSLLMQTAYAVQPRVATAQVDLSFNGTKAVCSAICTGNSTSDQVEVKMSLYLGNTCLKSWTGSGTYYVILNEEHRAASGITYKLVVNLTINGVEKPETYVINTCPKS